MSGPPTALSVESIYRSHAKDVARWAGRLSGPQLTAADLEDLVQEVFTLVHRHLVQYRGEAKLSTWLYRITENAVRQQRRRTRWRRRFAADPRVAEASTGDLPRAPDVAADGRKAEALLYRALEGMNRRHRQAIILFEIEELPGEEVAELLGIKVANLWVLLHRARGELARRVAILDPGEER